MWVFTTFGFFSIVAHRERKGCLLVRARCEEDIRAFRTACSGRVGRIQHTPDADYAYRLVVRSGVVADLLYETVEAIDYDNFKNAVMVEQGPRRAHLYREVWTVMLRLQQRANDAH